MTEFGNVETIVVIVQVEVIIFELFQDVGFVGEHQVRNKEGLEHVIQVWNHTEVVEWDESTELHVLNQGPHWEESNISHEEEDVLEDDDTAEIPVALDGELSEVLHVLVSEIELKVDSLPLVDLFSVFSST